MLCVFFIKLVVPQAGLLKIQLKVMKHYDTLSQAIKALKEEGYSVDFNLKSDYLECKARNVQISADDFVVDKMFRFEGMSNPDDSSILYAISSPKYNLKGLLVDAYSIYADPIKTNILKKLKYDPNKLH